MKVGELKTKLQNVPDFYDVVLNVAGDGSPEQDVLFEDVEIVPRNAEVVIAVF